MSMTISSAGFDSRRQVEFMKIDKSKVLKDIEEYLDSCRRDIVSVMNENPVIPEYKRPLFILSPRITNPVWMPVRFDVAEMTLEPDWDMVIDALLHCLKKENGEAN